MRADENKAIARRITDEFWNGGDRAVLDQLLTAGYTHHDPSRPDVRTREEFAAAALGLRASFPDIAVDAEAWIAEGDLVMKRWTMRGTHQAEFLGIPASGKQVSYSGMTIYRLERDQIVECWYNHDVLGLLQQLGVIPAPEQVPA